MFLKSLQSESSCRTVLRCMRRKTNCSEMHVQKKLNGWILDLRNFKESRILAYLNSIQPHPLWIGKLYEFVIFLIFFNSKCFLDLGVHKKLTTRNSVRNQFGFNSLITRFGTDSSLLTWLIYESIPSHLQLSSESTWWDSPNPNSYIPNFPTYNFFH